jgi:hypothetical protein
VTDSTTIQAALRLRGEFLKTCEGRANADARWAGRMMLEAAEYIDRLEKEGTNAQHAERARCDWARIQTLEREVFSLQTSNKALAEQRDASSSALDAEVRLRNDARGRLEAAKRSSDAWKAEALAARQNVEDEPARQEHKSEPSHEHKSEPLVQTLKWQNRAHEINGFLATARSDLALMTAERDKYRAAYEGLAMYQRPGIKAPNIGPNATVEARLTRLERLVSKL